VRKDIVIGERGREMKMKEGYRGREEGGGGSGSEKRG
jgi:hypothetical protein